MSAFTTMSAYSCCCSTNTTPLTCSTDYTIFLAVAARTSMGEEDAMT